MAASTIRTDIDFKKNGKQIGYLNFPSSVHDDAWGVLRVPIAVIRNGFGPTILLQGGNHGDEYEGPIVLGEIIRNLDPGLVNGRIIVVPAINLPAVEAGHRVSPIDNLNFNRTFPGDPNGSITQQISNYVHSQLFPLADIFVDLHSGGSSLSIVPSAIIEPSNDEALADKILGAVLAFDAPLSVCISNFGDTRTSTSSAVRAGLITIGTEMGGAGTVTPEAVRICRRGVHNLLDHFGIVKAVQSTAERQNSPRILGINDPGCHIFAECNGVFEPYFDLGTRIQSGEIAGRIHNLSDPGQKPTDIIAEISGLVFGCRHFGKVRTGNCCMVIASESHMP